MPKVPQLGVERIQEGSLNLQKQNTQVSAETFGGGAPLNNTLNAAQGVIGSAIELEQKAIKQANDLKEAEFKRDYNHFANELEHNPETGLMNKRGEDSFGTPDEAKTRYAEFLSEMEKRANTPAQKQALMAIHEGKVSGTRNNLNKHISSEGLKYDNQVTESFIESERENAFTNFTDDQAVEDSINNQKIEIVKNADRNGLPGVYVKQAKAEAESKTLYGIAARLVDSGNDLAAKAYFEKNEKRFLSEDHGKLSKILEQGSLTGEAQREVDNLFSQSTNANYLLGKARGIEDPKLRDEVTKRVKGRLSDVKSARDFNYNQTFEVAYKALEKTGDIDKVPSSVLANLSLTDKQALEKRASQLKSGELVKTDLKVYYKLDQMAGDSKTRNKFKNLNLLSYAADLSPADFKKLSGFQKDLRSGKSSAETNKLLDGIQTKNDIAKAAMDAAGLKIDKKSSKEEKEAANLFRQRLDQSIVELQGEKGRKVTGEEVRVLSQKLTAEAVTREGGWFGIGRKTKQQFLIKEEDVPSQDYKKIIDAYMRIHNREPTSKEVLKMYRNKVGKSGVTD